MQQRVFGFYHDQPARPQRPERLFFALFPDAQTSRRIGQLSEQFIREHRLTGTRLKLERLHISLQHVGDYPRLRIKYIHAAKLSGDAVALRPFDVEFASIMSFAGAPSRAGKPRRRPLVMIGRGEALSGLHKTLGAAMQANGLRAASSFVPHMTLLYGPKPVALQPIEPIRFAVREFTLVHSERGLGRYNALGRWRLKS